MNTSVDYIIVGQGICGTFLSYYLRKAGFSVLIIDEINTSSASRIASGVINPVTGRSVVTTWLAEEILPFAKQAYSEIGNLIEQQVLTDATIAAFATTDQMQNAFDKRLNEENSFIQSLSDKSQFEKYFHTYFDAYTIEPSYVLDLHVLLNGFRSFAERNDFLLNERFNEADLIHSEKNIQYRGFRAKAIFYCNGISGFDSKYWNQLPYALNKGQALIVETDLPRSHVYKFGAMSLVPWDNNTWWVGSSYENNFETAEATEAFRQQAEMQLKSILKQLFSITDHVSGIRPAVIVERRPFAGFHPHYPNVGILNGMGTKGCSLAPFFASQIAENISTGKPIEPLADVQRFKRILSEQKNSF